MHSLPSHGLLLPQRLSQERAGRRSPHLTADLQEKHLTLLGQGLSRLGV